MLVCMNVQVANACLKNDSQSKPARKIRMFVVSLWFALLASNIDLHWLHFI